MSSTIKKVIKVSYEQYHDLLTKGKTIDKDGNEHLYDDTASYNVYGYDELIALNNKIDNVLIKPIKVLHNPYNVEELDTIIARLREKYNETDSVVAFRCIMKKGQQLKTNVNYNMYLNETLREYDYTCENDNEMISIVLFAKSGSLNVTSNLIQFKTNIETYIEQKNIVININDSLYKTANLLTALNFKLKTTVYCEELICNPTSTSNVTICNNAKRLKYLSTTVGGAFAYTNATLEEANFDMVTKIISNYGRQPFSAVSNSNLVLNFPNLLTIVGGTNINLQSSIFTGVKHLIIGDKLTALAGVLISGECGTIELYCKNATNNMPSGNLAFDATVSHLYLCPDWNCPLAIHNIKNMTVENITEIFNNLKDLTDENSKTMTIKSDLYNSLSADVLAIATNKNWTIAYA